MKKQVIAATLCILLTVSSLFSAEIPSAEKKIEAELEAEFRWLRAEAYDMEVVTASRKIQKISEAPASIVSISHDQIEAYGCRYLKDIFRILPGIDVSYNAQGEIKTLVTMRGAAGNQKILILQDGHKYSPASGERFLYGHNIPLNIYKRIEIIYGPASSVYGADAYAGVINLLTKDGSDYNGVKVNAGYVSTGAYSSDVSFGKKFGDDSDILISAGFVQGKDEDLHEDYEEYAGVNDYQGSLKEFGNDYPIRNRNLFFKLRYKKFRLGFDWQHEFESNAAVSRPESYAYIEDFVWGQDLRHCYIEHDSYSDSSLNIKTRLTAGDYEVNPSTGFYIVGKDGQGNMTEATPAYKYACSSYIKGDIQADWTLTEKLSAVAGISYEHVVSFPKTRNLDSVFDTGGDREADMSSFIDPNGYSFGILGFREPFFGERNFDNFSLFIQTDYKFSDLFKLDAGLRYDCNSSYKETVNPRFGLITDPMENLTVKLLYGTAYIQPANFFRYENFANPFMMHIPNEDIRPEEVETYSADISYMFGKHFLVHAAGFLNKMTNIIRPVPAPAQADNYPYYNPYREDQGYVQYNGNQGKIESKGGEITLRYQRDHFLSSLSYSYLTGEDEGFDIPGISEHKIVLNSSYTGEKWTAGLTLRYYSDVSTDRNNYRYGNSEQGGDESYSFDGACIAYLSMRYNFNKHLSATLSIDNIFNTEHYGAVLFDGSPVVTPRAPQPLRQTYIGVNYSF